MNRSIAMGLALLMLAASFAPAPVAAQARREEAPPPYAYWQDRRDPPPGHEFRRRDQHDDRWDDRRRPPPQWDRDEWALRQRWLRQHGHDDDDHDAAVGMIVGVILGFALGAAVVDSEEQQQYAESRLNDPGWIAYCARRYRSFDPYTGTYLANDGLRHYCR